ncbi:acetylornithine deacetylase [Paracoccaceae bacterium GXU_MW_L88]
MTNAASDALSRCTSLLADLVAFPTVSGGSTGPILDYVTEYLAGHGITPSFSWDETGERANLLARIGPEAPGGVVLNGHTDVVPVAGQNWSRDPFTLHEEDGRLYGRGALDMKGFLACALAMVPDFAAAELKKPIWIALSYDEETGSKGAPVLAQHLIDENVAPEAIIVGEPTEMKILGGQKGGFEAQSTFLGAACHSSDPRNGVNAIAYAARFITFLTDLATEIAANPQDGPFNPPYNTINIGVIHGGAAGNVVAADCVVEWELRKTPPNDGRDHLARIMDELARIDTEMKAAGEGCGVTTEMLGEYEGMAYDPANPAISLAQALSGENAVSTAPFGTDATAFSARDLPAVIFGPGSIAQAHKPDEYIEIKALERCLDVLGKLAERQSHG